MNESSAGWLLPCFPVSPTGDISCSPSPLPRLRGSSVKHCCKEAVRSGALSRVTQWWHSGHHCQLHGNFTTGASGVSKTGVCWGFQHSSTLWGQQVGSDTFIKKIFIGKEKKIPKGMRAPSTGIGMAKAEGAAAPAWTHMVRSDREEMQLLLRVMVVFSSTAAGKSCPSQKNAGINPLR